MYLEKPIGFPKNTLEQVGIWSRGKRYDTTKQMCSSSPPAKIHQAKNNSPVSAQRLSAGPCLKLGPPVLEGRISWYQLLSVYSSRGTESPNQKRLVRGRAGPGRGTGFGGSQSWDPSPTEKRGELGSILRGPGKCYVGFCRKSYWIFACRSDAAQGFEGLIGSVRQELPQILAGVRTPANIYIYIYICLPG